MSNMNEREAALENKYALDQEVTFKIEARAVKLFALWLAEQMALSDDETKLFAGNVVSSNLDEPGFEDVKRVVMPQIAAKGLDITSHMVDAKLEQCMIEAKTQILADKK